MDLAHWIERNAAFTPAKPAIRFGQEEQTYQGLAGKIRQTCGRLASLGVGASDVVAFLGLNNPLTLELLFACARLGAILLPLNSRFAPPEHARVLRDCYPRAVIVEEAFLAHAVAVREHDDASSWVTLGAAAPDGWWRWPDVPRTAPEIPHLSDPDAPVLLCYTSGSTGAPKGVLLTQAQLLFNALNSQHMHDLTSQDRVLTTLPLFHVGGLNIQTLPALHAGATVTLHARFDPLEAIDTIERERITLTVLVPAQLTAMMELPRWHEADFSSLRVLTTGSTIVAPSLVSRIEQRGLKLIQVYGSTETCPIATYARACDSQRRSTTAGMPALHCEVGVVDNEDRALPAGENGEIVVRGPSVMRGYWNRPQSTAQAMRGGWYHTGDVGHFDADGNLHVVARKNDMIISGGENIYPAEVEQVLLECPDIAEACVIGEPDERWGEVVVAAIVQKPGARMSEADVAALFQGQLARYKHPRKIRFMSELPRTALGKIARNELRTALLAPAAA